MIEPHSLPFAPGYEPVSIFGSRVEDACGLGDGEGSFVYESNDQSSSSLPITAPIKVDFDRGSDQEQGPSLGLGVFNHQSESHPTLAEHHVEANHPVSTSYDIHHSIHSDQKYHPQIDHTCSPVLELYPQVTQFSSNLSLPPPNTFDNSHNLRSSQSESQSQGYTVPIDSFPSFTTYPSSTLDFSTAPGQSIDSLIKSPTGLWTPLTSSIPLPFSSDIDQYPEPGNDFLGQGYQDHEYTTPVLATGASVHEPNNASPNHGLDEGEMTRYLLPFTPFVSDRQSTSTLYSDRDTPFNTDLKPSLPPCRANTYFSFPSVLGDQVHDLKTFGLKAAPVDPRDQFTQGQGQGYWNGDLGTQKLNVPDRGDIPNTSLQAQQPLAVQMQIGQGEGYHRVGRGDHGAGRYDLSVGHIDGNGIGGEDQRTTLSSTIGNFGYNDRNTSYHQIKSYQDPVAHSRPVYASHGSGNNDHDLAIMGNTYPDTINLQPRTTIHRVHPPSRKYTPSQFQLRQPPPHTYHHRHDTHLSINTHDTFYNPKSIPTPSSSSASTFYPSTTSNPILPGVNQLFDNYTSRAPTYSAPPSTIFPNALKWPHNHVYAPTPTHHRCLPALPHSHGPLHSHPFPHSNEARSVSTVSPAYSLDDQDRGQNFNHDRDSRLNREFAETRQMEVSISPRENDDNNEGGTDRDISRSASPSPSPSLESEEGVDEEEDKEEVLSEYKPNRGRCHSNGKAKGKAKGKVKGKGNAKSKGKGKAKAKGTIPPQTRLVPAIIPCAPSLVPGNEGRILGGYHIIYEDGIGWTDDAELKQTAEEEMFQLRHEDPAKLAKIASFPWQDQCGIYERANKRPRPQQQDDLKLRRNPTPPPSLGYEPLDYTTGPDTPLAANVAGGSSTSLSPVSTYSPASLDIIQSQSQAQAQAQVTCRPLPEVNTTPNSSMWSHHDQESTTSPANSITPPRLFNESLDTKSRHLPPLPTITTYWNTQSQSQNTSAQSQSQSQQTINNADLDPAANINNGSGSGSGSGRKISITQTPYSRPPSEQSMGRGRGKLRDRKIGLRGAGTWD